MRCHRFILLGVLAAGCSSDKSLGPPPPAGFDASGDWTYTDQVSQGSLHVTCNGGGILSLVVTGNTLTGFGTSRNTCHTPQGEVSDSGPIPAFTGTLSGQDIHFTINECTYGGTLYGAGTEVKASGPESCRVDDGAGHIYTLQGSWSATYVVDVTPPVAAGLRLPPFGDTVAVPGDTLIVAIQATDNKRLAWVGYELGGPISKRDSTAATGRSADVDLRTVMPSGTTGQVTVRVFARDSAGLRRDSTLAPLSIINATRRPMHALTLPAPVYDVAMDTKRGVAYLTYVGRHEIGVVNLASGTFASSIATTFPPRKLDLSAGGDSLIVSIDSQPALAIMKLTVQPPTMTVVRVDSNYLGGAWQVADNVRAMANGKVLVTLKYVDQYSCCNGEIVDYDLATGLSRPRVSADNRQWLARSWDGKLLATATGSTTPVSARVYDGAADTFSTVHTITLPVWLYNASADSAGGSYLFANGLFDGSLNPVRAFTDTAFQQGGGTVLSPDGTTAYLGVYTGFLIVRTSDGAVLERSRLPLWPFQLAISADGGTLVAVGGTPTYFDPPNNQVLIVSLR